MKPKGKWSLHLSSSLISEDTSPLTSRPTPNEKKKYPRHLSMHHEKELKKKREEKAQIKKAVTYCGVNNCKGYKQGHCRLEPETLQKSQANKPPSQ